MTNVPNKLGKFETVAKVAMIMVCPYLLMIQTVIMTALIGMTWLFVREKANSNILNSYPLDNTVIIICRFFFGINMMFTYPLQLYVVRDTLQVWFWTGKQFSQLRHVGITVLLVASTLLVSCLTCDLGIIIEITGGVAAAV
jgi:sodium-coupled neutral amino acid transporter 11